jgi:hypothetical protein
VHGWIVDECGKTTVKNSLAILVRVMEQAVRDGIILSSATLPISPGDSGSIVSAR